MDKFLIKYEAPEVSIVRFETQRFIAVSGTPESLNINNIEYDDDWTY